MATASKAVKVKVEVRFPLATGGPYKAHEDPETTVGVVRRAAMEHFRVHEEPGSRYYLAGEKDEEVPDEATLRSLEIGKPGNKTIKFTLVKELIQG